MNNMGIINVIRQKQTVGFLIPFDVYLDNQFMGSIKSGKSISLTVNYGMHMVSIKTIDKTINQEILVDDNYKVVNITCNCLMGFLTGRPNILSIN